MIIADTSALFAALDRSEAAHESVREFIESSSGTLVISPFVLAELDYLLRSRLGPTAPLALLDDVIGGAYELAQFDAGALLVTRRLCEQYLDLGLSLADASIVVLADRYATTSILTLDERHFRAVTSIGGAPLVLLPSDR